MPEKLYFMLSNIMYSVESQVEGTTEATTAESIITGDDKLSKFLESSNDLSGVTRYLEDIMYILVVLVIALAFLTILMYIYRFISRRKDPNYKKNDDDFLDN